MVLKAQTHDFDLVSPEALLWCKNSLTVPFTIIHKHNLICKSNQLHAILPHIYSFIHITQSHYHLNVLLHNKYNCKLSSGINVPPLARKHTRITTTKHAINNQFVHSIKLILDN